MTNRTPFVTIYPIKSNAYNCPHPDKQTTGGPADIGPQTTSLDVARLIVAVSVQLALTLQFVPTASGEPLISISTARQTACAIGPGWHRHGTSRHPYDRIDLPTVNSDCAVDVDLTIVDPDRRIVSTAVTANGVLVGAVVGSTGTATLVRRRVTILPANRRASGRTIVVRAVARTTDGRAFVTGRLAYQFARHRTMYGDNGATVRLGRDAGPTLLFDGGGAARISFFLDDEDVEDVFVCLRTAADADATLALHQDRRARATLDSGDDCLAESNGWRRLEVQGKSMTISSGRDWWDDGPSFAYYGVGRFTAKVEGLAPDTLYEYRIEQRGPFSTRYRLANRVAFRTPPRQPTAIRVAAIADLRAYDGHSSQRDVRKQLARLVADGLVDRVILPGDLSNQRGTSLQYYDTFFRFYDRITAHVPFYAIHGNHDVMDAGDGRDGDSFFAMFDLPASPAARAATGQPSFYSFDHGHAHFVALDAPCITDAFRVNEKVQRAFQNFAPGSPQFEWLRADLAATKAKWRIAFFHCPVTGLKQMAPDATEALIDLLKANRVQLIINGHWEKPHFDTHSLTTWGENRAPLTLAVTPSGGSRDREAPLGHCVADNLHRHGLLVLSIDDDAINITGINKTGQTFAMVTIGADARGTVITNDRAYCAAVP